MYKVHYSGVYQVCLGRLCCSCEEGKGISCLLGSIQYGKKGKEKQYHLPIICRLLKRISSGEKVKGTDILGKKIKFVKNWGWGRY